MKVPPGTLYASERGQVFVVVVLLMTLSLVIGTTISNRFLYSLRGYTRIDDQSKARATAESLLERLLIAPFSTLQDYIQYNSCDTNCTITIPDFNGQDLTATATLSFSGNSADAYEINVPVTTTGQLNLESYPSGKNLAVCWNTAASVLATFIYQEGTSIKSKSYAYYASNTTFPLNNFSQALPRSIYTSCFDIPTTNVPYSLRLKSYYLDSPFYIVPDIGTTLPIQGIKIQVTGFSGNVERTISALRTFSYAPTLFDFVLYQSSLTEALSNKSY